MVLSTAKMLDSTREKQTGRQQVVNQQGHTPNGTRNTRNTPTTPTPYTNYTGPSMVMRPGMRFKAEDWKRLTAAQQTKMKELAAQKRKQRVQTTVHLNNASTEITVATPSPSVATTRSSSASPDIRQLLSNSTSRDPNPSQVVFNGRTYTLNYSHCTYNAHQTVQEPWGALIDGGANGGLSGSDVVVLHETLNTADVTGIADNTLHQLSSVQLLHSFNLTVDPSLVSSTNMPTVVAVKQSILSLNPDSLVPFLTTLHVVSMVYIVSRLLMDTSYPSLSAVVCPTWTCRHQLLKKLIHTHMLSSRLI
jgi:hypothetical protein